MDPEEIRVLQYESSRGLEGWSVCCLDFDRFLEIKEKQAVTKATVNELLLESVEDTRKKYVNNWAMIPLTRAIDTLIITLNDKDSIYSRKILRLSEMYPDYINVI